MSKKDDALKLAQAVIDAARAAMDESFEAGNEQVDISIPAHLAAALSLRLDEYDREALAEQPAQQHCLQDLWHKVWPESGAFVRASAEDLTKFAKAVSAYPQPAQPIKPLTDAQIGAVAAEIWGSMLIAPQSYKEFARAIEAAHGIKENT